MAYLTSWAADIILFILLATIVDLLLPQNTFKTYAKVVLSLLLVSILLSPVFQLFKLDANDLLENTAFGESSYEKEIEQTIKNRKKEIHAAQSAYISEQVAVQMKSQAEEELKNDGFVVKDLDVVIEGASEDERHIAHVQLLLSHDDDAISIEPVVVSLTEAEESQEVSTEVTNGIAKRFRELWQLEPSELSVEIVERDGVS
ncbi:stage III sporulation protein AF [Aureibacillus halotolerans]|uniref:Stage III sporulation protein AF n=1 Tax=Aureibacillus halotolerans TaxID=1508390 RepID=A0A4R6U5Z6_9BACI|nr:stage III sporulation protein AF [Aureibacillus halotolerans]TDQ41651.1 stage III sporulation protein AF [Aureibacillus halotolerans]